MVKFLKFVLFIIIIAFAFALGVKFSDSFKGNVSNQNKDQIKVETEMNKAFEGTNVDTNMPTQNGYVDTTPLKDIENDRINDMQQPVIEYVDINVVEPMDNIPSTVTPDTNPQVVPNAPTPTVPVTPTTPNTPTAPVVPGTPVAPTAPTVPTPAQNPNVAPAPVAPTPVQNNVPSRVQPVQNTQPARR